MLMSWSGSKSETEGGAENVNMETDAEPTPEVKIEELSPIQKAQQGIIEKLSQATIF